MYQYLIQALGVPAAHIRLLLSEAPSFGNPCFSRATRENVLSSLIGHLRDNPDVRRDDNILFYFAGRGARYSLEGTFPDAEDTLDALCPADRGCPSADGPVLDISDRELSIFLEELRDAKGNSVTVIIDASYLVDTVQAREAHQNVRSAPPLNVPVDRILRAVDSDTRRKAGSKKVFSADWDWDERACMLLTSCLLHEVARETRPSAQDRWHGCFTRALICMLRSGEELTYAGLGEAVSEYMPRVGERCVQNPMVIGAREGELVWYALAKQTSLEVSTPTRPFRVGHALFPCCCIF